MINFGAYLNERWMPEHVLGLILEAGMDQRWKCVNFRILPAEKLLESRIVETPGLFPIGGGCYVGVGVKDDVGIGMNSAEHRSSACRVLFDDL